MYVCVGGRSLNEMDGEGKKLEVKWTPLTRITYNMYACNAMAMVPGRREKRRERERGVFFLIRYRLMVQGACIIII